MYNLSKVIDTGTFHTLISFEKPEIVDIIANNVPKVFKIDLKEMESPIELHVTYITYL